MEKDKKFLNAEIWIRGNPEKVYKASKSSQNDDLYDLCKILYISRYIVFKLFSYYWKDYFQWKNLNALPLS